ncbi:MAG: DUF1553 domain-containing protein, partial [Planctomycetaceae bacterium]|nr:DUF1553 domain-containing protein [Planctomycetaceae bacterium]
MRMPAGCAVCHDHKFDPLSTNEYYSLYAFFHSAADPAMDGNRKDTPPVLKLYRPEDEEQIASLKRELGKVEAELSTAVAALNYVDPALLSGEKTVEESETIWFEDAFPSGSNPQASGNPLKLVSAAEGPVFSGELALQRTGEGVVQDYFSGGAEFVIPAGGTIFVHCYLDPDSPPEAVMIQFHTSGWLHRAIWGAEDKIPFGASGTTQKFHAGELPEAGRWVRLAVKPEKMGLKAGDKVVGYAFTQCGGTVTWDHLGVSSRIDKAKDPAWSFTSWKEKNQGKRNNDLPDRLRDLVRGKKPEEWSPADADEIYRFWLENFYANGGDYLGKLKGQKSKLNTQISEVETNVPITMVMADLPQPRQSFVMQRGAYDKPGDPVTRNVPAFLPPLPEKPEGKLYDRLDLANWLVSGQHPLTARVTVNRIWQQFFGTGLVKTSADFGSQGDSPSHPELLDWLAVDFVEHGWDVRRLVRMIVLSETYRQTAACSQDVWERDPENRYLARGPRLRLDAEVLRDQALFVSGLLVKTIGGPGVNPYQPPNIWEPVAFGGSNTRFYKQGTGEDLYRRSLYTFLKRTAPPPFLSTFDAPNREQSCSRRERTNTPLQALQLMNDVQYYEAARQLAVRMIKEGGQQPQDRLQWCWELVTSRKPESQELETVVKLLQENRNRYQSDLESAKLAISYGESKPDAELDPAELAAYTLVANLILNLDEVINKN